MSRSANSVVWFEIYVDDMSRAKNFYETVFQTKLDSLANPGADEEGLQMWAFPGDMQKHGTNGAICKMQGFGAGRNSTIVYFACEDCSVEESRVVKAGGKVEKSKFAIGPHGFISLVHDTEGNIIGLHSMQ
jgi:predicted enzyme related to lactoylglutathione lyase